MATVALLAVFFPLEASAQKVAILASDADAAINDVKAKLIAAGVCDITVIKVIEASPTPATPTLAQLQQYDAILNWSNFNFAAPGPLGDVLADYVDQGGGVVQAVFAFSPGTWTRLGGRWRTASYGAFNAGLFQLGAPLTLTATQPGHPILSGVTTFNGGSSSYHYAGIATQGAAQVIARWSNTEPLVAAGAGPNGGRVVGLNFYPPSSTSQAGLWDSTTGGALLMANSLRYAAETPAPGGPTVVLVAADDDAALEGVRCRLQNEGLFTRVDTISAASSATPTVASLLQYDAVLTWSDSPYGDSTSLGNALADYIDQGGGVVQAAFISFPAAGSNLDGRWRDGGYRPFSGAAAASAAALTPIYDVPGHVVLSGVPAFTGGAGNYHHTPTVPDAFTARIASWSDAEPLVAVTTDGRKRVVGLNLFPPAGNTRLIGNTLVFAANHFPEVDAGADQTIEATSAAAVSFTLTGTASDLDADSLAFSWSGAGSATGQTVNIDVPPPTAPSKTQTVSVTLTVSDGKGGETTDTVSLTVTDTAAPVLSDMPSGIVTADATSASGATVAYGPITALDAVDGNRPVVCSQAGVFPVGDTVVTCSTSDTRDNTASASFTVRVSPMPVVEPPPPVVDPAPAVETPGSMKGAGFVRSKKVKYEFNFAVSESASGVESVRFSLHTKAGRFVANTMESCKFGDHNVLFSGRGSWKGAAGHRYTVFARDHDRSRRSDRIRMTITAPNGKVVLDVEGDVNGGKLHWIRVEPKPKPKPKVVAKPKVEAKPKVVAKATVAVKAKVVAKPKGK